jgi:phospholipase D1/2
VQVNDERGPREPWHDLHSKIDGPAAFDVLKNFEERWLKASKRTGAKRLTKSCNDTLLWIEKIPEIAAIDDEIYTSDSDPERWDIQVKLVCSNPRFKVCGRTNVLILNYFTLERRYFDQSIQILSRVFLKIHEKQPVR